MIVQKYREEGLRKFGKEFYIRNKGAPFPVPGRTIDQPTFWEFVQGITRLGLVDRHWNPVYLHCNLCHTTYHFILKLETLAEDEEKMFKIMRFPANLHHLNINRS